VTSHNLKRQIAENLTQFSRPNPTVTYVFSDICVKKLEFLENQQKVGARKFDPFFFSGTYNNNKKTKE